MRTILFLALLTLVISVGLKPAAALPATNLPRIGLLAAVSPAALSGRSEAFRRGLRDLEYLEGKNILIESRFAAEKLDRLPALTAELRDLEVRVIVTAGAPATRVASETAKGVPIVMAQDNDPVGNGFVESLAHPGGNITGLSTLSSELAGKRLELLREIVPKLRRVYVLSNSTMPGNARGLNEIAVTARAMGVQIQTFDIRQPADMANAFDSAVKGRGDALLVLNNPILSSQRTRLASLAIKSQKPAVYERLEYVEAGGLMSYGVSSTDLFRRAAIYVDKILKGAKPADLPVEQPMKFEFVINLKTAKQIGITIPQWTLMKADRVIR